MVNETGSNEAYELPDLTERPLVTFALFAYNQEKYIREAVEGAFSQTYEPLEIILSDDCSTDRTFEIMQEMAAGYKGPHKIKLNRNSENMGISPHVRYVHEMSKGDFVVHAAGDDISLPQRTRVIISAINADMIRPSIIKSNAIYIDCNGVALGEVNPPCKRSTIYRNANPMNISGPGNGCTFAISRELIDKFKPPMFKLIAEDNMLMIRANLINGCMYIPDSLVKYRIGSGGVTSGGKGRFIPNEDILKKEIVWTYERISGIEQAAIDIKSIDFELYGTVSPNINCYIKHKKNLLKIMDGKFIESTVTLFIELLKKQLPMPFYTLREEYKRDMIKFYLIKWFPLFLHIKSRFKKIGQTC